MSGERFAGVRFRATRPELPPMEAWRPFLEEAYRTNWHANFGAVSLRLEDEIASRWGFAHSACVATSSGTAALAAPLIARRIGGPVIVPAFTFPATYSAVKMAGAEPHIVDVDSDTWRTSANTLENAFAHTGAKAAIVVAPFGLKSDFSAHIEAARAHGGILVIDNAAGLGVKRADVERSPDVFEIYSLHATKPFGVGEGGAILSHRSNTEALRAALNFGLHGGDAALPWGINGKMAEAPAAIGLAVAQEYEARLHRRRALARRYMGLAAPYSTLRFCDRPEDSAWQVFPVLTPAEGVAEAIVAAAQRRGMEVRRYYRPSLSQWPGIDAPAAPSSEGLAARMICFPVYSIEADSAEAAEMLEIAEAALHEGLERA